MAAAPQATLRRVRAVPDERAGCGKVAQSPLLWSQSSMVASFFLAELFRACMVTPPITPQIMAAEPRSRQASARSSRRR